MTQTDLEKDTFATKDTGNAIVHKTLIPYQTSEGTVGFKPIKEIEVGDMVFNRLGKPIKVKGVFPQENKLEVFKVKLDDNRALLVNDEHLWDIVTPSGYKPATTHEIMHMLDSGEHVYIPRNHTVKTDDDPTLSKRKAEFKEKYHISSRTTDTEILFNSSNEACDCVEFARELGYKATPHSTPSKEQYTVHITNYIENKIEVKSVTDLGFKKSMTCLYVDDHEHLFMAGDFVVTHNTTVK